MNVQNTAVVEHLDSTGEVADRLRVWAALLRDLGLAEQLGVFASIETGLGLVIRVGRHDGEPMTETRGVVLIPRPRLTQRKESEMSIKNVKICDFCGKELPEKELTTLLPASGRKADAIDVCSDDQKSPIADALAIWAKKAAEK